ncbi:hypothetical protein [Streptomyces olivoreticuli]|uniref:hypothetical protein n=1 Tax=Streptomyces olivoreticuli TaxID=68246 RepID=UPI0013C369E1|nr:hypothetical protein [Streptomyces olivoreticuli]
MTRTGSDLQRRRNLANVAHGHWGERVPVVLYACVSDCRDAAEKMAALRRVAAARDWVVRAALYDVDSTASARADRKAWPEAERLLEGREVQGLVAPDEDEIALHSADKARFREWLLGVPAFALYPLTQTVQGAETSTEGASQ